MDAFLAKAREEIEKTAGHLKPDVIARPRQGRWSIAEILEHLTLSLTLNRATLDKALASGEVRARRPRLAQWLARTLVIDVGYFPRAEAPDRTQPQGSIPPERSLAAIREALLALDGTLGRVSDRFGEGVMVANHPYFAGLTVGQWRKFHWRHTVHHMRQVRERLRS